VRVCWSVKDQRISQYWHYVHQGTVLLGHLDDVNPEMVSGVDHVKLATVSETPLSQWRYLRIRRRSQCSAAKALLLARALEATEQAHREVADRQKY
jgi:hypothetical protein